MVNSECTPELLEEQASWCLTQKRQAADPVEQGYWRERAAWAATLAGREMACAAIPELDLQLPEFKARLSRDKKETT